MAQRSIFEEVGDTHNTPAKGPRPAQPPEGGRRLMRVWLVVLLHLVVAMILLGGATRLTDSGLSITEWDLVMGALPPMSEAAWTELFAKYQATEEFAQVNSAMTLTEFETIFWWEWAHRNLGRLIGLVWILGFAALLLKGALARGWMQRLLLIGVLIGVQGAVGWWMVSSGIGTERVDVAPYRLAVHLGLAFAILGLILWAILLVRRDEKDLFLARRYKVTSMSGLSAALVWIGFVQILLGALVAGLDAGRGYIDWPLMNGQFLPDEAFADSPLWMNFFENEALTQFDHRMVGYLLLALGIWAMLRARSAGVAQLSARFRLAALGIGAQAVIGVMTVMLAAPLWAGLLHQAGAMAAWAFILMARFAVLYPPTRTLR